MNTSRYAVLTGVAVIVLVAGVFLSTRSGESGDTSRSVRIGFIAPTTGPFADLGESILHGMHLAVEDTHHAFTVDYQDDECSTEKGVNIGRAMLDTEGIRLIVGPGCSDVLSAIAPIADQKQALMFSTGLLPLDLLQGHTSVMNFASQISTEAQYMAAYLAHEDVHTAAFVHGTSAFGMEFEKQFPPAASAKQIDIVLDEASSIDATDFRTTAAKIKQAHPEAVFIHQGETQIGLLAKQLRTIGYTGALYGYYGTESPSALAAGGSAMEGLQYTFPVNKSDDTDAVTVFNDRYKKTYGVAPTATSLFVYDGMMLLDQALDRCKPRDTACIKKYFVDKGTYTGLSGDMTFNADGSITRPFGIKQIKNGEFVWVTKDITL